MTEETIEPTPPHLKLLGLASWLWVECHSPTASTSWW